MGTIIAWLAGHVFSSRILLAPPGSRVFLGCWLLGQTCCVSDNLYGRIFPIQFSHPENTTTPPWKNWTWFHSAHDLELGLQLRQKFFNQPAKITLGMMIAVGFNPLDNKSN